MNQGDNQWKSIYILGAITALIALVGILLDVIMGTMMGGNLTALPQTSWLGIAGGSLMLMYILLLTFVPSLKDSATAVTMPGGLMVMAWMILLTIQLFKLGSANHLVLQHE